MSISSAIREVLKKLGYEPYGFQTFNKDESLDFWNYRASPEGNYVLLEAFRYLCSKFSSFEFPFVPGNIGEGKYCRYPELEKITDFKNSLQLTEFGRLFRGTITEGSEGRPVIVKTWDFLLPGRIVYDQRPLQFCDEIELYERAIAHKYLAKLSFYCCERRLAVVYDEVYNIVLSDVILADNFGWEKRINVATQLAELLAWLHDKSIAIGIVNAYGIMIDEELNDIKVFDFAYISHCVDEDPDVGTMKSDVYVFGLLLMELINKRKSASLPLDGSIVEEAKRGRKYLVHECFQEVDDQTASTITELTSRCLSLEPEKRPKMREVFSDLGELRKGEEAGNPNSKTQKNKE